MNFGKRLKEVLQEKGIQQAKIAEVCELSNQQVSRLILKDQQPRNAFDLAMKISGLTDVNAYWLAFGIGTSDQITNYYSLPVLSGDDLKETNKSIPVLKSEQKENLIAYKIDSTALEPDIPNGAIAVIDTNLKPRDSNYILLKTKQNNIMLRKIFFKTDGVTLKSNADSVNCLFDDIEILGIAKEFRVVF